MLLFHSLQLQLFTPPHIATPLHLPTPKLFLPRLSSRFLSIRASSSTPQVLVSDSNDAPTISSDMSSLEVDAIMEVELKENGFSPTCGFEQLEALAVGGMNVTRLNMCHGTREWHKTIIDNFRRLNDEKGFIITIMMDIEGSEIHMGDLSGASSAKANDGEIWTFSVRAFDSALP